MTCLRSNPLHGNPQKADGFFDMNNSTNLGPPSPIFRYEQQKTKETTQLRCGSMLSSEFLVELCIYAFSNNSGSVENGVVFER